MVCHDPGEGCGGAYGAIEEGCEPPETEPRGGGGGGGGDVVGAVPSSSSSTPPPPPPPPPPWRAIFLVALAFGCIALGAIGMVHRDIMAQRTTHDDDAVGVGVGVVMDLHQAASSIGRRSAKGGMSAKKRKEYSDAKKAATSSSAAALNSLHSTTKMATPSTDGGETTATKKKTVSSSSSLYGSKARETNTVSSLASAASYHSKAAAATSTRERVDPNIGKPVKQKSVVYGVTTSASDSSAPIPPSQRDEGSPFYDPLAEVNQKYHSSEQGGQSSFALPSGAMSAGLLASFAEKKRAYEEAHADDAAENAEAIKAQQQQDQEKFFHHAAQTQDDVEVANAYNERADDASSTTQSSPLPAEADSDVRKMKCEDCGGLSAQECFAGLSASYFALAEEDRRALKIGDLESMASVDKLSALKLACANDQISMDSLSTSDWDSFFELPDSVVDSARDVYDEMDVDADGLLSLEEWEDVLAAGGVSYTALSLVEMRDRLDDDHDGLISFDELTGNEELYPDDAAGCSCSLLPFCWSAQCFWAGCDVNDDDGSGSFASMCSVDDLASWSFSC